MLSRICQIADFMKSATDFLKLFFFLPSLYFSLYHDLTDSGIYLKVTPILSSTPPWLFTPPKTIFIITQFPKNQTSSLHLSISLPRDHPLIR